MVLIVLSHTGAPRLYSRLYTPVFLSMFFFISGYTFTLKNSFDEFFKRKLMSLLIPFVSLGSINMLLSMMIEHEPFSSRIQFIISRNGYYDDLWFVACLFSCQLIFYAIVKLADRVCDLPRNRVFLINILSLAISILGVIYSRCIGYPLPFQVENSCVQMIFLSIGHTYKCYLESKIQHKNFSWIFGLVLYVIIVFAYDNHVSVAMRSYQNYFIYLISSIVGFYVMISICKQLESYKQRWIVRFMVFMGQNTLVYYAFQSKAIKIIKFALCAVNPHWNIYILPLIITCICIIVLIVPAVVANRYFPMIVGKKKM